MCNLGLEDIFHIFFECPFAAACWSVCGYNYDLTSSENEASWLLAKLDTSSSDEVLLIARVLWGVWFFRNQKVWENKVVTADIAMGWSSKIVLEWREARETRFLQPAGSSTSSSPAVSKWQKPALGTLKLNVDAAVKVGESKFAMGLVLRDHNGSLVSGKTMCKAMTMSVFEAEALAVFEGLKWLLTMPYDRVVI